MLLLQGATTLRNSNSHLSHLLISSREEDIRLTVKVLLHLLNLRMVLFRLRGTASSLHLPSRDHPKDHPKERVTSNKDTEVRKPPNSSNTGRNSMVKRRNLLLRLSSRRRMVIPRRIAVDKGRRRTLLRVLLSKDSKERMGMRLNKGSKQRMCSVWLLFLISKGTTSNSSSNNGGR